MTPKYDLHYRVPSLWPVLKSNYGLDLYRFFSVFDRPMLAWKGILCVILWLEGSKCQQFIPLTPPEQWIKSSIIVRKNLNLKKCYGMHSRPKESQRLFSLLEGVWLWIPTITFQTARSPTWYLSETNNIPKEGIFLGQTRPAFIMRGWRLTSLTAKE